MPSSAPDLTQLRNRQIRLASRPVGLPTRDNWRFTTEPVAEPAPAACCEDAVPLARPGHARLDERRKSYIPPVGIDEVMRAGGIGIVVASKNPRSRRATCVSAARRAGRIA
jgi:NADPH-dependent curcumin reductase CurA